MDVNGKVEEFGFPASNEMRPGVFSNGMRLLTATTKNRSAFTIYQAGSKEMH